MGYDSVIKVSEVPGSGPRQAPYLPEDTVIFYVELGRRGDIGRVSPACDPALPQCAAVLPSGVALELRRVVPGLPVWLVPEHGTWVDTLAFDDTARSNGPRGTVVTSYGPVRDTVMGGLHYWVVPWRAERRSFRRPPDGAGFMPEQPSTNDGLTLIDKARLIPVFSTWLGAVAAPPQLQESGVDASGFRARAYLVDSPFDSAFAPERRR
jgi:hypothetical protein